jgi:hypothetical protein
METLKPTPTPTPRKRGRPRGKTHPHTKELALGDPDLQRLKALEERLELPGNAVLRHALAVLYRQEFPGRKKAPGD